MLNAKTAAEQLKQFEDNNAEKRQAERIRALPEFLRDAAFALLGCKPDGTAWVSESGSQEANARKSEAETAAAKTLDAVTTAERIAVFSALYPKLGEILADWWMPTTPVPYQAGYYRKAFRLAPDQREVLRPERQRDLVYFYLRSVLPYPEQDITFYAAWAPYIGYSHVSPDTLGRLFAAAINRGGTEGEAVFQILRDSARGEHETGAMGRHVTRALLSANRPDGWEFCEKLLLAAQREEGLRQVILETVDEAHPEAFRRMLRLITEHNLTRFSATIRALDTWFGFGWEAPSVKEANTIIGLVSGFLQNPAARDAAIAESADGQAVYLALWAMAFDDASAAILPAAALLADKQTERRFAAVRLLAHIDLPESKTALLPALDDAELPVVVQAANGIHLSGNALSETDLFERLERTLPRLPKMPKVFEQVLWPWLNIIASQTEFADSLTNNIGNRELARLLPYLPVMSSDGRSRVARAYAEDTAPKTEETRDVLFSFLSEASSYTRDIAFKGLQKFPMDNEASAVRIEGLLTRKSADLRRSVLELLQKQDDSGALGSAARLLGSRPAAQRLAGLDLLGQMTAKKRSMENCREIAARFAAERGGKEALPEAEQTLIAPLLDTEKETPTLENALGLMDPTKRTTPISPRTFAGALPSPVLVTPEARRLLVLMDAFVDSHREIPVRIRNYAGDEEEIFLGDSGWRFPSPDYRLTKEEDAARCPLRAELETWWTTQEPRFDPADILRAAVSLRARDEIDWLELQQGIPQWLQPLLPLLYVDTESALPLVQQNVSNRLVSWLLRLLVPTTGTTNDFLLDAGEYTLTLIPEVPEARIAIPGIEHDSENTGIRNYWRQNKRVIAWISVARDHFRESPADWSDAQITRLWNLVRYLDEPFSGASRIHPNLNEVLAAFRVGAAREEDVYDQLLGERSIRWGYYRRDFSDLKTLSGRRQSLLFEQTPGLREIYEKCRARILEIELARGDTPTVVTSAAQHLRYIGGVEVLIRLLKALGKESLVRSTSSSEENRAAVLSNLVRATFPG